MRETYTAFFVSSHQYILTPQELYNKKKKTNKGTECEDKRNLYDTVWRIPDEYLIGGC